MAEVYTIYKHEDWTADFSGCPQTDWTSDVTDNFGEYENSGRARLINDYDTKGSDVKIILTEYQYDNIDAIVMGAFTNYGLEIKNLNASCTEPRYIYSQLAENIKVEALFGAYDLQELEPVLLRYFTDNGICFKLRDIDFTNYVTINNPPEAVKQRYNAVSKQINEYSKKGILVRCQNWICPNHTADNGEAPRKVPKDCWFIPNSFGKWKTNVTR